MRRHSWWLAVALAGMLVLVAVGIAGAATSPHYNLTPTSFAAGGAGGGIAESDSYVLLVGVGGLVETSSTSASYNLCLGFVCGGGDPFLRLRMPFLTKGSS